MSKRKPGDWWDKSWTLVEGCPWPEGEMPPACEKCWARGMAKRWNPDQVAGGVKTRPDRLDLPRKTRKPTVFACQINYGDLFHEEVPSEFIRGVVAEACKTNYARAISLPPAGLHTFVFLTKRWERAAKEVRDIEWTADPSQSPLFLLASVWDQESTNAACAAFAGLPIRWGLHMEPMLGPVDIEAVPSRLAHRPGAGIREWPLPSWIVVGGETGPKARAMHPDWVRAIRDQCQAAGVPFWFKGWGAWAPLLATGDVGPKSAARDEMHRASKARAGRQIDGREWSGVPWDGPR